jgi:hypothetical protein
MRRASSCAGGLFKEPRETERGADRFVMAVLAAPFALPAWNKHSRKRYIRVLRGKTLLTCIDGLCGNQGTGPARYCGSRLDYNRLDDRLLASAMDTARRDALKSVSRANSSDPGDLPSIAMGLARSLPSSTPPCTERQDLFYRGGSEWRDHRHKCKADL